MKEEKEERTEPIMLGWKRGDNAADDRVCLLIREREEEGERFNPIRGNNSEKRVLKRFCRQVFTADGRLGVGRGKGIN